MARIATIQKRVLNTYGWPGLINPGNPILALLAILAILAM
jgi:hypothetical protein